MKISNKAFTLIELMIVVVILGILMSTVLPKLTWAQARARDTARIADLSNISAALWVYYDDNWQFPAWWDCLSATWWTSSGIMLYMQNSTVPQDPQRTANQHLCSSAPKQWKYYYHALEKDGLKNNAFVLCADMETYQKANTNANSLATEWDWADVKDWSDAGMLANEYTDAQEDVERLVSGTAQAQADADASHTVYCILRP